MYGYIIHLIYIELPTPIHRRFRFGGIAPKLSNFGVNTFGKIVSKLANFDTNKNFGIASELTNSDVNTVVQDRIEITKFNIDKYKFLNKILIPLSDHQQIILVVLDEFPYFLSDKRHERMKRYDLFA